MAETTEYQSLNENTPAKKSWQRKILTSLTFWIIVGTGVGILLGAVAPGFSKKADPMSQVFLRPIQFIVFPLVFSCLVVGIAGHNDMKLLGRLAWKSFLYFEIVTTLALIIGLIAVNVAKPGEGTFTKKGEYKPATTTTPFTFAAWINHLTPKTWGEMMGGSGSLELLQVLVAAILVGISTAQLPHDQKIVIVDFCRAVMQMMFKFVDIVMWTAPIGVCFAIASAIATNGIQALNSLAALVLTVYVALFVFIICVFGPIFFFFKINPVEFVKAMREPLLIGYTTATSEAALPKVFECLDKYGVSPHISAFVVPFGYSFNLDGSTLYLSLTSIFCAQVAGIHKSIGEQIVIGLMLIVSSKGVAGVRAASIVVLASTVDQFNIPSWPVALVLGADWIMNMARACCNVLGNCLVAVVMAKIEGEFRTDEWKQAQAQLALEEQSPEFRQSQLTAGDKLVMLEDKPSVPAHTN